MPLTQPEALYSMASSEDDENFLLQWNNKDSLVSSIFASLRLTQDFIDVTLVSDDISKDFDDDESFDDMDFEPSTRLFGAHRVILSAFSPYLRKLLKGLPSIQHPVIFLKEVPAEDLEALLTFIYIGKVQVSQNQLPSFLRSAEILRIRGLSEAKQKVLDRSELELSDVGLKENVDPAETSESEPKKSSSKRTQSRLSTSTPIETKKLRLVSNPGKKKNFSDGNNSKQTVVSKDSPNHVKAKTSTLCQPTIINIKSERDTENFRDDPTMPEDFERPEQIVIPSLSLDSTSIEDRSSLITQSSSSEEITDRVVAVDGKTSLCPFCRAVLSNGNALSYHMSYLHGVTDSHYFDRAQIRIKEDPL